MRFLASFVLPVLTLVSGSMAYSITARALYVDDTPILEYEGPSDNVDHLTVDSPKSRITLGVKFDSHTQPHQLSFLYTDGNGLDHAVYPGWFDDEAGPMGRTVTPIAKLPPSLLAADKVQLYVIAANDDDEVPNLVQLIADIEFSDAFRDATRGYTAPTRLGAKPEIHHVFRSDQATVNPIIPVAFSAIAAGLLIVLLGAWGTTLGSSLFRSTGESTMKTSLLVILASFEYTFIRYYLGATIFTTIFHVAVLAVPALIVGSKALSLLAKVRSTPAAHA